MRVEHKVILGTDELRSAIKEYLERHGLLDDMVEDSGVALQWTPAGVSTETAPSVSIVGVNAVWWTDPEEQKEKQPAREGRLRI